jgi:steroid delta-isomerase-like uncharacterized protein
MMSAALPVRQIIDAFNQRTLPVVAPQVISASFRRHDMAHLFPDVEGPAGVQDYLGMFLAAMPDARIDVDELFDNAERAALRYTLSGTHTGEPLLGVAADGRELAISGVNTYRIEDGKIAETWQLPDGLSLYRQLGLINS